MTKTENWLLGIDLGGTTIKLAFIDMEGNIIHKWEVVTNIEEGGRYIVSDIGLAVRSKLEEYPHGNMVAAGMGAPGPVDFETGSIYEAVNIGWKDFPLQSLLEAELGVPCVVDNDANVASYGEFWKGAGAGTNDLVCITLGTGVGGGIIANQKLVHGISGAAGEIGHTIVVPEGGATCNCGHTGCLETVASATGIVRLAMEEIQENEATQLKPLFEEKGFITAKDVFDCAANQDESSKRVIDQVAMYLGLAAANVGNCINPDIIVFGGGVSKAGEALLIPVQKYFNKYAFPRVAASTKLGLASLGNDAGVIGAAGMALSIHGEDN